jgi:RNA polymerase sigma factor (sigma-70 family)
MEPPAIRLDALAAPFGRWPHAVASCDDECVAESIEAGGASLSNSANSKSKADGQECPTYGCHENAVPNADWLREVIARWEGPLVRYAVRVSRDLDLGRDAVQETFLRLCRLNDDERSEVAGHLTRWLFTVCRSRALDAKRKESRMSVVLELDERLAPDSMLPDEMLEQRETEDRAIALLDRLPETQQEVIRLKFQNDLSYREIADITGHSVSNVGFLLHTGIKRLRELMKGDEEP